MDIALFGFGCVGQGLYDALGQSHGFKAGIQKIGVKDRHKPRKIAAHHFSFDSQEILGRSDIQAIVELVDNAEDALSIVRTAMQRGLHVVSANKKLLAEHFGTLFQLQQQHGVALLYEGACAGSIPIIRNLEEYYDTETLHSISGIINGSSNYILTRMDKDGLDYHTALAQAQELGFAEIDPWLDVAGFDPKYKLVLLVVHAFGVIFKPEAVLNLGIQNISAFDIEHAALKGQRIKLVAYAARHGNHLQAYVLPRFVGTESNLINIDNEYNAVEIEGAFSGKQLLVGKGAGSYPTGAAVLSDVAALSHQYRYEYKKLHQNLATNGHGQHTLHTDFTLRLYIRYTHDTELEPLDIIEVIEQYTSPRAKYLIAEVAFASLYALQSKENKLFVAVV